MEIVYSSTDLLKIHKTTTVNGNDCYEIQTMEPECPVRYVFTPHSTIYMALKYNGAIHIFNLKEDGNFPHGFKQYIDSIKDKLNKVGNPATTFLEIKRTWRDINKNPHNFAIICGRTELTPIPLINARAHVASLNEIMRPYCPGFHLMIDHITSFPENSTVALYHDNVPNWYVDPSIVLCLFTNNHCVSSITMKMNATERGFALSIDSRTDEQYEGRKFNILLRAVAIIISKSLSESAVVFDSYAINWISAYIMINHFNAVSVREGININKDTPHLGEALRAHFRDKILMDTRVELNDVNTANATRVFHETIQRMNCGAAGADSGGGRNPKRRMTRRTRRTRMTRMTRRIS